MPSTDSAAQHRALVEAANQGDRRAAAALVTLLLPRVRNLVRYLMRGDADVDDIAQEALVTILRGLPGYRGEGTVTAWSDRIVARSVFAHLRRSRASVRMHVEYTPDLVPVPPGESAHGFLGRRQLARALDVLPEDQRVVLVMHHAMGLSVREIAEEIEIPFETVRSRLRLGMARLRSAVADDDEPEARSS
ncbi:MAG: RNA polymerase sigma factor [Polyangiales bacterium]